jgi:hypothetical protein
LTGVELFNRPTLNRGTTPGFGRATVGAAFAGAGQKQMDVWLTTWNPVLITREQSI